MSDERPLEEQVLIDVSGGVMTITLNRPEVRNAVTRDQRERVIEQLGRASDELEIRAVILTATGKGFCTGADLRSSAPPPPRPEDAPDRTMLEVSRGIKTGAQRSINAILDCDKPVIAAVNGTAAGIGAHMAFACDLVVAAESARFIEVFVRRGIVPDGAGAYLLPRLVGPMKAKELMFFGDDLSAADAESIGLVTRTVADDDLMAEARALADRLAGLPTKTLTLTKMMVNRSLESDRATMFELEAMAQDITMQTRDAQEGVASFVERRTPEWKGW